MIDFHVAQGPATPQELATAFAALDHQPGIYFGVDAGVKGLHPLQATLMIQPCLRIQVRGDGLVVQGCSALGDALLAQAPIAQWRTRASQAQGGSVQEALNALLALFKPSPDVLLLGALRFEAHLLNSDQPHAQELGVLFLGERLLRRDGPVDSEWRSVTLSLKGVALQPHARAATEDALTAKPLNSEPQDDMPPGGYAEMVRHALVGLRHSPLVSLTLSQCYRRTVTMPASEAFQRLRHANPAPASFFMNDGAALKLLGASPDLQLVIQQGRVVSLPVCGTVARRPGPMGEALSFQELINEDVDAASLAVCTDALRNDLAPFCEPGSLQLLDRRQPMMLSTVVHTVDRLSGQLKKNVNLWEVILATAAPVMVTGTPRKEALEFIQALEASPRNWYGGLIVQVASNGHALVGTILRAAAVEHGVAQVRTGGDLMADSSPEREEQESRLKTLSVWRAFGLAPTQTTPQAHLPSSRLDRAVRLLNRQDAFAAAVQECLTGIGIRCVDQAPCAVVIGLSIDTSAPRGLYIGDAALTLLQQQGWPVTPTTPENGRVSLHRRTHEAPEAIPAEFISVRYARQALTEKHIPDGWQVWTTDEHGVATCAIHRANQWACLLFRPESLMSDAGARTVLQEALNAIHH
jgi:anthranilate/para-aminobenzoate synthase component I